jgi:hypothetical protein
MIIDPSIVHRATAEAEAFRLQHTAYTPKSTPRDSYSPQHSVKSDFINSSTHMTARMALTPPTLGRRLRLKRAHGTDNPYGTPVDTDAENASETSSTDGYFCSPGTPNSLSHQQAWTPRNMISHSANSSINLSPVKGPSPWLSAIPRSTGLQDVSMSGTWRGKRRAEEIDADDEYDGGESCTDEKGSVDVEDKSSDREMEDVGAVAVAGGAEKKAAWLLMKLSVKDGETGAGSATEGGREEKDDFEGPRVKRRRATSM